jgi:hypothetical protein
VSDPTSPAGAVLDARYGARSSGHSCTNCPATGGGEFYTEFTGTGHPGWTTAPCDEPKIGVLGRIMQSG